MTKEDIVRLFVRLSGSQCTHDTRPVVLVLICRLRLTFPSIHSPKGGLTDIDARLRRRDATRHRTQCVCSNCPLPYSHQVQIVYLSLSRIYTLLFLLNTHSPTPASHCLSLHHSIISWFARLVGCFRAH